jgi:hypothetical protein
MHHVLGPELGSVLCHVQTHVLLFGATVLGFEIKGGLHEVCTAQLAKETVADAKVVKHFLEGLQFAGSADIFIITWLQIMVTYIV